MLRHVVSYKNIDGKPVDEEYHFGLSATEMIDIYADKPEFLEDLETVRETRDPIKIIRATGKLLTFAVGKRMGDRFVKNQDILDGFMQTNAFESLLFELLADDEKGEKFMSDLMPDNIDEIVAKMKAKQSSEGSEPAEEIPGKVLEVLDTPIQDFGSPKPESNDDTPAWLSELRAPTKREMMQMSTDELALAMRMKQAGQLK